MSSTDLETRLRAFGVVPVVEIRDASAAPKLGAALAAGGLPVAEITFRTPAAADAIRQLRAACPDVLVGAGTVLDVAGVDLAVDAGAEFVVTPGLNPVVVEYCLRIGLPIVPGVNSPSQVEQGLGYGLGLLKFFPAVASGGLAMLSALAGPYRSVSFMPTGGITDSTLPDWLAHRAVAAVGGSWIATADDLDSGRFAEITDRARYAVQVAAARAVVPDPTRTRETEATR